MGPIAGTLLKFAVSPLAASLGLLGKKKKAIVALPAPAASQDELSKISMADAVARRRGSRGNLRAGVGGAEASTGGKTSLLGRSS